MCIQWRIRLACAAAQFDQSLPCPQEEALCPSLPIDYEGRSYKDTDQTVRMYKPLRVFVVNIWAATWQNQQCGCASSEDSDQPGHLPSLIRVFAVRMKKPWVLSYPLSAQRRLWSDWADAHIDLSLCWAHTHFIGFVLSRLILFCRFCCAPTRYNNQFCKSAQLTLLSLPFHKRCFRKDLDNI